MNFRASNLKLTLQSKMQNLLFRIGLLLITSSIVNCSQRPDETDPWNKRPPKSKAGRRHKSVESKSGKKKGKTEKGNEAGTGKKSGGTSETGSESSTSNDDGNSKETASSPKVSSKTLPKTGLPHSSFTTTRPRSGGKRPPAHKPSGQVVSLPDINGHKQKHRAPTPGATPRPKLTATEPKPKPKPSSTQSPLEKFATFINKTYLKYPKSGTEKQNNKIINTAMLNIVKKLHLLNLELNYRAPHLYVLLNSTDKCLSTNTLATEPKKIVTALNRAVTPQHSVELFPCPLKVPQLFEIEPEEEKRQTLVFLMLMKYFVNQSEKATKGKKYRVDNNFENSKHLFLEQLLSPVKKKPRSSH